MERVDTETVGGNPRIRIVGSGRAGGSFAQALSEVGVAIDGPLGRHDDIVDAARDVDGVILAVPDRVIGSVASSIAPGSAVVLHLSGATGLDALTPHERVASLHPLMSLPDAERGARLLRSGITYAVAGDALATRLAQLLHGTPIDVPDSRRAAYHAAASMASNHSVALWAQIERVSARAGVDAAIYHDLLRQSVAAAVGSGAESAITGPAMRGDWEVIRSHLAAIGPEDRAAYVAMATEAARLGGRALPVEIRTEASSS